MLCWETTDDKLEENKKFQRKLEWENVEWIHEFSKALVSKFKISKSSFRNNFFLCNAAVSNSGSFLLLSTKQSWIYKHFLLVPNVYLNFLFYQGAQEKTETWERRSDLTSNENNVCANVQERFELNGSLNFFFRFCSRYHDFHTTELFILILSGEICCPRQSKEFFPSTCVSGWMKQHQQRTWNPNHQSHQNFSRNCTSVATRGLTEGIKGVRPIKGWRLRIFFVSTPPSHGCSHFSKSKGQRTNLWARLTQNLVVYSVFKAKNKSCYKT